LTLIGVSVAVEIAGHVEAIHLRSIKAASSDRTFVGGMPIVG